MELRPYQTDAVRSLYSYFATHDGNPLVVMPTGTGKSVVISEFLSQALQDWSDTRVLALTHVRELITQNASALLWAWPDAPAGIYSAGLNKRDIEAQILFAGIQSIHKKAYHVQRCDLVLIDEAHLIGRSDNGMYRRFLNDLRQINPALKIIGFTATPYRMDSGMLHEGDDRLFTDIAYEVRLLDMIEQGYLCPVVPKRTATQLDVSGVGTRGGEFISGELERAVDKSDVTSAAVDEIVKQGQERGSWLAFCSGVRHAEHVRDAICDRGISCEMVAGDTPPAERDATIRAFKSGQLRALTNANVLTTGFDAPGIDLIALLRPTKSIGLYVQMLGRGTRLAEGKDDCLVLDFAGNTSRHGPLDMVDGRRKGQKGEGPPPTKECPECHTICFAGVRQCPDCGHEFPPPPVKINSIADASPILSTQAKAQWLEVQGVFYAKHEKEGRPPSLRVEYQCGLVRHREWIALELTGYPRQKACSWWARRAPTIPVPFTVADALTKTELLAQPTAIQVKPAGKYVEIVGARFA